MNQPVAPHERVVLLDALRGFALLGIYVANVNFFAGYVFMPDAAKDAMATAASDRVLEFLQTVLVDGKFYSLFSLLFGVGFAVILSKAPEGLSGLGRYYRRILVLLAIGFIHLTYVWEGDILMVYALIALFLPLFRSMSDRALVTWVIALLLSPILLDAVYITVGARPGSWFAEMGQAVDMQSSIPADETFYQHMYKEGSGWKEWREWQASAFYYRYEHILNSNRIPKVLALFLLGFVAGRKGIHRDPASYLPLFRRLRNVGLAVGLPASLAMAYFDQDGMRVPRDGWYALTDSVTYALSVVPLSLGYVSLICLAWMRSSGHTWVRYCAPAGRMALTNYILQTLMAIVVFYGLGLGWGTRIGPTCFIPIVVLLYLFQVVASTWWLKHFRFGPLEWVWRQITYGKRMPLQDTPVRGAGKRDR